MMRDFRKYDIWKEGIDFTKTIYELTADYPKGELFGLTSQMRRAAVSMPSNVAEGASRNTEAGFSHFIEIAIGSSFELETQLIISNRIKYVTDERLIELLNPLQILQKKLNSFHNTLNK